MYSLKQLQFYTCLHALFSKFRGTVQSTQIWKVGGYRTIQDPNSIKFPSMTIVEWFGALWFKAIIIKYRPSANNSLLLLLFDPKSVVVYPCTKKITWVLWISLKQLKTIFEYVTWFYFSSTLSSPSSSLRAVSFKYWYKMFCILTLEIPTTLRIYSAKFPDRASPRFENA